MALIDDLIREATAQSELGAGGSVMAKKRYQPGRLGVAGDVIQGLLEMINPLEWMGGQGLAHIPGTFRKLGLQRQMNVFTPGSYLEALQAQSNYPRYKQLVENLVRRVLGGEFKAYRGTRVADPLMEEVLAAGKLPTATAASLDPKVAEEFSRITAGAEGVPSHIARFTATPEAVLGLTPKRSSMFAREAEILLDPSRLREISLQAKVPTPPAPARYLSEEPLAPPDALTQELIDAVLNAVRGVR